VLDQTGQSPEPASRSDGLVAYFGYGSLVNKATHRTDIVDAFPACLVGWRRHWRPRPDMAGFPAAMLTVRREEGAMCDGLLVIDRAENLAAIDAREARYRRIPLQSGELEMAAALPAGCPVYFYEALPDLPVHPEAPMILQSYLDAVLQGFLAIHGEEGVRRFIADTAGFDIPIHADRLAPKYPRAVRLRPPEEALFDGFLADMAARFPAPSVGVDLRDNPV
jgi:hypothetical protein